MNSMFNTMNRIYQLKDYIESFIMACNKVIERKFFINEQRFYIGIGRTVINVLPILPKSIVIGFVITLNPFD